ncbi:protein-L-isoaspartate O-methyltransferase [Actinoplanes sp. TRM 88003]|uniref:Protein-L-isoaspartate O-methyltransferase n=1 Tax=Paractinoplanes aksuensis TaxID=2939490 RepID=A0ABT1E1I9_9ACTN|nr:protein-L-isoaspartate O-methyltransferase [Actinoplanes aksuensis]MCO8277006.1 protein-L-isoaspartate O-methyltransferase [Actinoplanes aksuensis]
MGPREAFLDRIRRGGLTLSPQLAAAFAEVPREVFVPDGFQRRDGTWAEPADPDFLQLVYDDDVLVTKVDGRTPISSSSQPSLMALMIEALDVRPGLTVLEIGAGTGYNAALLSHLGASVISVDVQADVASRARSALARAGVDGVRVVLGDGYQGLPGVRVDRVIVTVGVAGVSPQWLEQLDGTPDGVVVAPVEHAGTHPVLRITADRRARVVSPSSFMVAAGPLTAAHPFPAPAPPKSMKPLVPYAGSRFDPPLEPLAYRDLWYAAGVWHRRATYAAVPGHEQNCLMVLDEQRTGGAAVLPDGSVAAGGDDAERYAAEATAILDRWIASGRPPMQAWRVELAPGGDPEAPILLPGRWELTSG